MNTFISYIILPFQYIIQYIFSITVINDLSLGSIMVVAGIFGAILSVITRSSISLGSSLRGFKGSKNKGISETEYYDNMAKEHYAGKG